jgi:outer membrane protein
MTNRLSFFSLVFSIVALGISVLLFFKKDKIVYVDSIKLIANYNGAKALKIEFDAKAARWKSNLDTLASELEAELDKYEKINKTLSSKSRQEAANKLESMKQQYENYKQAVNDNARNEDQRITTQVLKEITAAVKKYGDRKGYAIIMGATTAGNIVYADPVSDVTDEVLSELNQSSR